MYLGGIVFTEKVCLRGGAAMRRILPGVFGNDATRARIGAAVMAARVPHAFLIDGCRGSGRYTLALEISAALNCENRHREGYDLPCRLCSRCRQILGEGHVDIHVLARDEGKATIGVDEVKALRADMFLSATEAEQKVYIIRDADRLTPEAQNALLIVLEEPPRGVVIMLLAAGTDKILTTIKSRAQYIPMERFSLEKIEEYLRKTDKEADRVAASDYEGFRLALLSSDGSIGRAKELLTPGRREEIAERNEIILGVMRALDKGAPFTSLYRAISALPTKRVELTEALESLISAVRDTIALHYDEDIELSFFTSREEAQDISDRVGLSRLNRIYDILLDTHSDNSKNANITTLVASLASRIRTA